MPTLDVRHARFDEKAKIMAAVEKIIQSREDIYLSVILPAYNESRVIEKTLRRIEEYFSGKPFSYEIIVVTDGPRDDTIAIVRRLTTGIKNLRLIDRKTNRGKGYTVREGMLAARGKVRLFMDADNGTDISHFDFMRPFFDKGFDVVISSRNPKDVPGGERHRQPMWRNILGNTGNLLIQFLAVPGIWDTQNGFKAFRAPAAEKIFSLSKIDRWAFDVEVLALARRLDYKIGIIPARWINVSSAIKLSSYISFLREVVKIRWNFMRGKYRL